MTVAEQHAMVTHLAARDNSPAAIAAMLAACCLADLNESEKSDG